MTTEQQQQEEQPKPTFPEGTAMDIIARHAGGARGDELRYRGSKGNNAVTIACLTAISMDNARNEHRRLLNGLTADAIDGNEGMIIIHMLAASDTVEEFNATAAKFGFTVIAIEILKPVSPDDRQAAEMLYGDMKFVSLADATPVTGYIIATSSKKLLLHGTITLDDGVEEALTEALSTHTGGTRGHLVRIPALTEALSTHTGSPR
jgi:hypothetical protein